LVAIAQAGDGNLMAMDQKRRDQAEAADAASAT
jgi:hypothetical protein